MERTSETLTIDEVIEINRQQIDLFGGFRVTETNLRNRDSLEFALDSVDAVSFGQVLYPTLADKASMLGYTIIKSHVFHDGSKRTAIAVCRIFLLLNGFDLAIETQTIDEEAMEMFIQVANSECEREELTAWIEERMHTVA